LCVTGWRCPRFPPVVGRPCGGRRTAPICRSLVPRLVPVLGMPSWPGTRPQSSRPTCKGPGSVVKQRQASGRGPHSRCRNNSDLCRTLVRMYTFR
jgi:hypothetical protein